jgi:hypothetical protein
LKRCERCKELLPDYLLFTPKQVQSLDKSAKEVRAAGAAFVKRMKDTSNNS